MSGHSKWANIKNRKGAQDKKRSETFTKMSKIIMTAIRLGGNNSNVDTNSYLKITVDKAKAVNMPKENIDRLLSRFEERKNNLTNFMLEGFGPFGVPLIVEVETDNKNRTLGEIKLIFKVNGGNLGESGSVAFQFERKGEVEFENPIPEDKQLDLIDAGATDVDDKTVWTEVIDLVNFTKKVQSMGMEVVKSEIVMKPINLTMLNNEEELGNILDFIDSLEENDDVINVFAGFDYVKKT
ncbi:MAG: YebC/PmpR family DNA-binding transcriptional regulator [Candidatus Shapirobacteria bacterium]|nr:YebC/PmpR family DNA-binding transcriptional regulator [Candidatus Shapirobacteria bacterium]